VKRVCVVAFFVTSCMAHFYEGPVNPHAVVQVNVVAGACTTPAKLFDCKDQSSVGVYLVDYFKQNGVAAGKGATVARATYRIFEDRNVVAVEVVLEVAGGLVWRADAKGDTLLRALIRLETLLASEVEFKARILTSADLRKAMEAVGRKEVSATSTGFVYR
jgi:hypothetical protein